MSYEHFTPNEGAKFLNNPELPADNRPELNFQPGEKEQWSKLADQIIQKIQLGEPAAVSLVRCWNKDQESVGELADRFDDMQKNCPELIGTMISINGNANGDKNQMTTEAIKKVRGEKKLPAVTTEVGNYTWTAGLNGPTALLHHILKEKGVTPEQLSKIYILNQSFDMEINGTMTQKLSKAIKEGGYVLTIREEGKLYEKNPDKQLELSEKIKEATRNPTLLADTNFLQELARAGRNTAMIIPLSDIVEMGGFSNACNPIGGMEDHDLYMRLLLKELDNIRRDGKISTRLKKMVKAFANPVVYNDPAWNKMVAENKQAPKVAHEGNAIKEVATRIQDLYKTAHESSDYTTPIKERDFIFSI